MTVADAKPDFAPAELGLYRSFAALGYNADALTAALVYNRLKSDDPQSYYFLAKAFLRHENPKRAAEIVGAGLTKSPSDKAPFELLMATAHRMAGKLDSATIVAEQAFSHASNSPEYYEAAADYLEASGKIDSAMNLSRLAYESGKSTDMTMQYFDRALRTNYFTAASNVLNRMDQDKVPALVVARMRLALNLAQNERMGSRRAGDSLQIVDRTSISSVMYGVDARGSVGDMLSITQDLPALEARLLTGNFVQPFRQFMTYAMGVRHAKYDLSLPVLTELQKIRDVHANLREVKLRLALGYWTDGMEDSCFALVKTSLDGHQNQPEWLTQIGDIYAYISMRRYDDAAKMYRLALEKNNWYIPAFESYVAMYTNRDKPDSALLVFDEFKYFAEQNPVLALLKAQVLVEAGRLDEGLKLFAQKIPADRGNIFRFSKMLNLLEEKKLDAKAAELNALLVKLNSDDSRGMVLAARFNSRVGRAREALDCAQMAVHLDSTYADAAVEEAHAMYLLGKKADAIKLFESNLERFPNDAMNQYYFSQVLADEKIDFARASNLAREAVFNAFGDPEYVLNLSRIYYQMGRFDLCRGEAIKARNAMKDNPMPYYRLGMASYHLEGKQDDAKESLKMALDLGLQGVEKDSATLVLRNL